MQSFLALWGMNDAQTTGFYTTVGGVIIALIGYAQGKRSTDKNSDLTTEAKLWDRIKDLENISRQQEKDCDERMGKLEARVAELTAANYELREQVYSLRYPEKRGL